MKCKVCGSHMYEIEYDVKDGYTLSTYECERCFEIKKVKI